jgi:hypothetical protein
MGKERNASINYTAKNKYSRSLYNYPNNEKYLLAYAPLPLDP